MIYASGNVTIITNKSAQIRKTYKRKALRLHYVEQQMLERAQKVTYTFEAFLQRDFECRFLEDYTGKIKPFIEKNLQVNVVSIQLIELDYVNHQSIQTFKK